MAFGTVKVYSPSRGSGWIRPDSGGNLVYVHKSGIVREQEGIAPRLAQGQRVEFQIGQRPKGPAAINVRPAPAEAGPSEDAAAEAAVAAAEAAVAAESETAGEAAAEA
jgi:CspA family cold shock protein